MSKGKTEKGHQTPNTKHQTAKHSIVFLSVAFHYSSCSFSPSLSLFVNRGASFFDVHYVSLPAFLSFLYSFLYHSIAPSAPFRLLFLAFNLASQPSSPPTSSIDRFASICSTRFFEIIPLEFNRNDNFEGQVDNTFALSLQRPPTATNEFLYLDRE
jgi:hypothetical protein